MSAPPSTPTRTAAPRAPGAARRGVRGAPVPGGGRSPLRRGVTIGAPTRGGGRTGRGPAGILPTGRAATVVLCGAVLVAALLLALWINIALSRGSYAQHDLEAQRTLLAEQQQALEEHLQEVSSASALDARARAMGMVRAPESAWLVLQAPQDQAVVGDPEAATVPTPSTSPSGTASASPSSSVSPSASGVGSPDASESASGSTPSSATPSSSASSTGGAG